MIKEHIDPNIAMGILSAAVLFFMSGVPSLGGVLPVINLCVFIAATIFLFVMSFIIKDNTKYFICSGIAFGVSFILSGITEGVSDRPMILAISWGMSLAAALAGLIRSVRWREKYKYPFAMIGNSAMILIALITGIVQFISNKGFVVLMPITANT
jgi:prepilin signal peptidase PulO-like enzyme (type II secretory pathway)